MNEEMRAEMLKVRAGLGMAILEESLLVPVVESWLEEPSRLDLIRKSNPPKSEWCWRSHFCRRCGKVTVQHKHHRFFWTCQNHDPSHTKEFAEFCSRLGAKPTVLALSTRELMQGQGFMEPMALEELEARVQER
ncbi:hypothetical protein MUP07_00640 [Candidatus Bathyarchaeota archaeon]|nr:hypothetical protein [Candidatus Bathyarchaeota archaeon]